MKTYENKEMCKACGGICCKTTGCLYLPENFKSMEFKYLKRRLKKGNISISGQPANGIIPGSWTFILYLRARNEGAEIVDLINNGGPCVMLGEHGCKIKNKKYRPSGGLTVIPMQVGGPCKQSMQQSEFIDKWLEHQEVLNDLIMEFTNQVTTDLLNNLINKKAEILMQKSENVENLSLIEQRYEYWFSTLVSNRTYYTSLEEKELRENMIII